MVGLYESRLNVLEFSCIKLQDLAKTKIKAYMVMRSIDKEKTEGKAALESARLSKFLLNERKPT